MASQLVTSFHPNPQRAAAHYSLEQLLLIQIVSCHWSHDITSPTYGSRLLQVCCSADTKTHHLTTLIRSYAENPKDNSNFSIGSIWGGWTEDWKWQGAAALHPAASPKHCCTPCWDLFWTRHPCKHLCL